MYINYQYFKTVVHNIIISLSMVKKKIKTRGKKNLKIIKFPNRQKLVIFQGKKKIEVYYRRIKINKSMYNR